MERWLNNLKFNVTNFVLIVLGKLDNEVNSSSLNNAE